LAHVKTAAYSMIRIHGSNAVWECEETIRKLNRRLSGAGVWPEILAAVREIQASNDRSDKAA
jgi:hypothetical protein